MSLYQKPGRTVNKSLNSSFNWFDNKPKGLQNVYQLLIFSRIILLTEKCISQQKMARTMTEELRKCKCSAQYFDSSVPFIPSASKGNLSL